MALQSTHFEGTARFTVRREIGAGGMGVVYEALDVERNTLVALKTLRRVSPHSLYRLKQEFRTLQNLQHPNLVNLGELWEEDGTWFFTMELIEGTDLRAYVRPKQDMRSVASALADTLDGMPSELLLFDERRLRDSLRQLTLGLCVLHDAGKVHRDIKPSNILVTTSGRLVLLDFGLVIDTFDENQSNEANVVGTVAYMAPEQAASKPVGPAADLYSVGVLMYEAMSGRLPFRGNMVQVSMDKQHEPAPSLSGSVPGLPGDLSNLCMELLRANPVERPTGRQVLERLGVAETVTKPRPRVSRSQPFFGRAKELEQLRGAADTARDGTASAAIVIGVSGLGKSALLRKFTQEAANDTNSTVVLTGRCYERESVPYKALDGVIDALSHYLLRIGDQEAAQLSPRHVALLPRVFPVLGRVPSIAEAPLPKNDTPDPHELRRRIIVVLRELFHGITDRHPLILVIDDLQWADVDSLSLLAELLRPPHAPPLLLLASARAHLSAELSKNTTLIELGPLSSEEAELFAGALLKQVPTKLTMGPAEIAKEAAGHPLFIDELVRHAATATETDQSWSLDEAIWTRVNALPYAAKKILQLTCLAAASLPEKVVHDAADVEQLAFDRGVAMLRTDHLVRGVGITHRSRLKPYHDRVREAVVANMSDSEQKRFHMRLAGAIEGSRMARDRPEHLLRHLEAAGQMEKAESCARDAAQRAAKLLAFDRSAELYRVALRLHTGEPDFGFLVEVGEALSNAGYGLEAAGIYRRAAERTRVPADALEMKRRAAEKLLQSGHIEEGLVAIDQVLASIGMRVPKAAIPSLLYQRAKLRLRGLRFTPRDESEIPAEVLQRIDICWSVTTGLSMVDPVRGSDFQTRALIYALRAGEIKRIARGLGSEAGYLSTSGGEALRARALLKQATELSLKFGDVELQGFASLAAAAVATCTCTWPEVIESSEKALDIFRKYCSGVTWEINTAEIFRLTALGVVGRLVELREALPRIMRHAEARGDRLLTTSIESGLAPRVSLAADDSAMARTHIQNARRAWTQKGAHVQHLIQNLIECEVELYEGRLDAADTLLRATSRQHRHLLPFTQGLRVLASSYRATIALGRMMAGDSSARRRLARETKRLRGEGVRWSVAFANLFAAERHVLDGNLDQASTLFTSSCQQFEEAGMLVHSIIVRRVHGLSLGATDGEQMITAADNVMRKLGVENPASYARVWTGGAVWPSSDH